MCDSLTVYTPPKSSLRVFFFLLSPCHKHTHTHTYILVPFIIHDLLDGRRLCLRRIRHSWLCVLEPNMYVEKRLFFSSVVYPPFSFLPCLFYTFYVPHIHICICICIQWYIDRFLFLHLHCRHHGAANPNRLSKENLTVFCPSFHRLYVLLPLCPSDRLKQ